MKFTICNDPQKPDQECKAARVLEKLVSRGQLKSYDPAGIGNCFSVATGITFDMAEAGVSTSEWFYAQGECGSGQGLHAWLEYDGWAIDFSSGTQIFTPISEFRRVKNPRRVKRYSITDLHRLLSTEKGKAELGIFGSFS